MTIDQVKLLPSYDALKRNGLSDQNIIEYYSLPKGQRGAFFNTFKVGVAPTPTRTYAPPIPTRTSRPTRTVAAPSLGTQKCTFAEVDAEFRRLMNTDFVVNGVTYNPTKLGYSFKWNNNKSRFGVHKVKWRSNFLGDRNYTLKSIELSRYMLQHAEKSFADWVDTILHEIAHAIDYAIRRTSNHDYHWVRVAKAIGCSGERCGHHKINAVKKYEAVCGCGTKYTRHKLTQSTRYNSACGRCSTPLTWKQNF